MVKLKQIQDNARKFYFEKWKGNEQPSPAFDGEIIVVTRRGWRHIIYDKKRPKSEVLTRLGLLRTAKRMLESKRTVDGHSQRGTFEYWFLRSVVRGKVIRVVVRSSLAKNSSKHFYSVFVEREIHKNDPSPTSTMSCHSI